MIIVDIAKAHAYECSALQRLRAAAAELNDNNNDNKRTNTYNNILIIID